MANSLVIRNTKNSIIRELIKDKDIIAAIDSNKYTGEELINTHIFTYNLNPYTINEVMTFITLQVHIPDIYNWNRTFVKPQLEIWIISHVRHMKVDNIPKIVDNRNDYLSILLDNKLNGKKDFGIGKMKLIRNIEGSFQADYLYRKMTFEGTDLNFSMCEE